LLLFGTLRRQLWYYALLLGLYLALTAAGVLDASFLCGLAVLYGTLLPTTCFSYDEAVHWERYAAATPAGRRGTVDGKYLLALLLALLLIRRRRRRALSAAPQQEDLSQPVG